MPPRSLKSLITSVSFPSFVLGHDPTKAIIVVSYGSDLAIKLANDCRVILNAPWYGELFPAMRISSLKNTEFEVATTRHGLRLATSIDGTLTGRGGDILILDDPADHYRHHPDQGSFPSCHRRQTKMYPEIHCQRTTRSVRTARARTVAVRKQPPTASRRRAVSWFLAASARCAQSVALSSDGRVARSPPRAGHAGRRTDRARGRVGSRASPLRGLGRCDGCWAAAPILPLVHRCCDLRLAGPSRLPRPTPPSAPFQAVPWPVQGRRCRAHQGRPHPQPPRA